MDYFFIASIQAKHWQLTLQRLKVLCGEGDVLCPLVKRQTIRPRRKIGRVVITKESQMFLGYIAVQVPKMQNWYRLAMIPGVRGLLCADEKPILVPRSKLRGMLAKDDDVDTYEGKLAEVIAGLFEGTRGIYEKGTLKVQGQGHVLRVKTKDLILVRE